MRSRRTCTQLQVPWMTKTAKMTILLSPTIWPSHQQSEHPKTKDGRPIESDSIPTLASQKVSPLPAVGNGDGEKPEMTKIPPRMKNRNNHSKTTTDYLRSNQDWDPMTKMTLNQPMPKTLMLQPKKRKRLNPKKVPLFCLKV